jgi:hypothetical protein
MRRLSGPLLLVLLASACGPPGPNHREGVSVVRSTDEGIWDAPRHFVDEMSIGALEGEEEYMLGAINQIAVDEDGGIYAYDFREPSIRYYDADGTYVRSLGGEGEGPGEYRDAVLAMKVRRDGRLVIRDARNLRLSLYGPDGSFSEQWHVESGLFTSEAMFVDRRDHAYLKIMTGRPERNKQWPIALLHLDDMGTVVDTIPQPTIDGEPLESTGRFGPAKIWTMGPDGSMVVGLSADYTIEVRRPDGSVLRIERDYDPVELAADERLEYEAVNDWYRKYQGENLTAEIPPVPSTKPAFKGLTVGDDGRIWVELHGEARKDETVVARAVDERTPPAVTWREPEIYDVFEADGDYLGRVLAPERTGIHVLRGDTAWGLRTGESGERYIVRMHLEPMQGAPP